MVIKLAITIGIVVMNGGIWRLSKMTLRQKLLGLGCIVLAAALAVLLVKNNAVFQHHSVFERTLICMGFSIALAGVVLLQAALEWIFKHFRRDEKTPLKKGLIRDWQVIGLFIGITIFQLFFIWAEGVPQHL